MNGAPESRASRPDGGCERQTCCVRENPTLLARFPKRLSEIHWFEGEFFPLGVRAREQEEIVNESRGPLALGEDLIESVRVFGIRTGSAPGQLGRRSDDCNRRAQLV